MRIQSAQVKMASVNLSYRKSFSTGGSFLRDLNDFAREKEDESGERDSYISEGPMRVRDEPEKNLMSGRRLLSDRINRIPTAKMSPSDELSLRVELFREMINAILYGPQRTRTFMQNPMGVQSGSFGIFRRVVVAQQYNEEHQETTFESEGLVRTEDGREIGFNVQFSMSRTVAEKFEAVAELPYILTDPLVINLSDDVTHVSDQKFFFDLDCDGEKEEMNFAGEGSGFLALDKDGDGRINDGSELFGPQGGDGFAELARYDSDGNGWIDENDGIFDRLRVWTKDSDGNDILLTLKDADVGAIALGNVDTSFSLYSSDGYAGELGSTGIYLHESDGHAGLVSHVDLAT